MIAELRRGRAPPTLRGLPSVWSVIALVVGTRVFARIRTDRMVRRISAAAGKRYRARSKQKVGRWAPWSLILIGGLIALVGVGGMLAPSQGEALDAARGLLAALAVGAFITFLGVGLLPQSRRHGGDELPRRSDAASCHCAEKVALRGPSAEAYAVRHLDRDAMLTFDGIERLRCPLLDRRWLLFPVGAGPPGEVLPMLAQVPVEASVSTPSGDDGRLDGTGHYL